MDKKVTAVASASPAGPQPFDAAPTRRGSPPKPASPRPAEMRLVIEEDPSSGAYIYKTINRLTGEVVQQLPSADVLKLREQLKYAAGALIRTDA